MARDLYASAGALTAAGALCEGGSCGPSLSGGRTRAQCAGGGGAAVLAGLGSSGLPSADGGGAGARDLPAVPRRGAHGSCGGRSYELLTQAVPGDERIADSDDEPQLAFAAPVARLLSARAEHGAEDDGYV